jgi:hypothetical protein
MKRWSLRAVLTVAACASFGATPSGPSWPQWGQNPQHTGFINVAGDNLNKILADVVYDPLVPNEQQHNDGDLLVHYQVPLVEGSDVYMESKSGNYSAGKYASQTWHQNKFTWVGRTLVKVWTFDSDWVAPGSQADFWEPVYHATLANGFVYDMGGAGTIFKLDKTDGSVVKRINPFGTTLDLNTYTAGPITADAAGNLYYNVVRLQYDGPFYSKDAVDSWLVKVAPNDSIQMVSYTTLNPGAPAATDLCYATFGIASLPWPPSPDAIPGKTTCGLQRAALNIAPAIAPDGTIYSLTRAHFVSREAFLVAINPNLTLKWATNLRGPDAASGDPATAYLNGGFMHDGCNDGSAAVDRSLLPLNGQPGGCRAGARGGVDPATNRFGGGRVLDDSSSTPTVAPDGSILYGAFGRYNWDQGHLMRFAASGQFLGFFTFGWDLTPAVYPHDLTYSIVLKSNHYGGVGSYCNDPVLCPEDRTATNPASPEEYFVTQLRPDMSVEWSFKNTNTESCTRLSDGSVTCVSDHPNSFEWCVNAAVVDSNGIVYANSEDGHLFAIRQGGTLKQKIFQQLALGAAYTPTSLGSDGRIYSQNAGHLFVVGER